MTHEDWAAAENPAQLHTISTWVYGEANIDSAPYLGANSIYNARKLLFKKSGDKLTPMIFTDSDYNETYATMLVPNGYGGVQMDATHVLTPEELQIGDIFCGAFDKTETGAGAQYTMLHCIRAMTNSWF